MNSLIKLIASGFGLGYAPFASGTFGTLLGVLILLLLSKLTPTEYLIFTIVLFFISVFISSKAEKIYNKKDAGVIVIDEVCGFIVTMAFIQPSLYSILFGFAYFRLFDILKPWPASAFNRMHGGFAVVLDDVSAGIYANVLLRITMAFAMQA